MYDMLTKLGKRLECAVDGIRLDRLDERPAR